MSVKDGGVSVYDWFVMSRPLVIQQNAGFLFAKNVD